jgi:DNA-binding SARP family transcriptional activator
VVEFSVLGPLEAVVEGRSVPLPAAKPRALLALLLLNRNRVVSVGELVEELWGGEPPETATKALQVYVSQLRKGIGADRVLTKPPGYSIRVDEGELDLDRFEQLVREGRERLGVGDAEEAAALLEQALALWRGPALAEFGSEPFARDAGARLEESRLEAI